MDIGKKEAIVRIVSIVLLVLSACLVGLDTQTKLLFYTFSRRATFRDLNALYVLVWIVSAAAVYNLVQLFNGCILQGFGKNQTSSYRYLAWGIYLLDQAAVYIVFAATTAAVQAAMFALNGEKNFQWMKVCDKYKRFCIQIGGALLCCYFAALLMAITSSISAYALFRLYSPKHFLMLKGK